MTNITDQLCQKIIDTQNPSAAGIDTKLDYLPESMTKSVKNFEDAAKAITEFNFRVIDSLSDVVPAVKVQVAYYEMYSVAGMKAFYDTVTYAKQKGLVVMADVKRNDIGSTAGCYAKAFLGETAVGENKDTAFPSDYATVNAYLGIDGIEPFLEYAPQKGIYALVRTSNPSGAQLQNRVLEGGKTVYEYMGTLVSEWGRPYVGEYGYSSVGAVVGATHPEEAKTLRKLMSHTPFLVPGYGAQGGTSDDVMVSFDERGLGAIVNNSRGILCAYKKDKFSGMNYWEGARAAATAMQEDLMGALNRRGVQKITK